MDKKNSKIAGHHQDLFQLNHDIFLGSKITAAGDCSHGIRRLLPGRKVMTNLDSVEKQMVVQ